MEYLYHMKSGVVFKFLLKVFLLLFVLNLLVISLEFYLENYTTSNLTSRYTFQYYVTGMFYFDGERNIPTYFSTLNLLFGAGLLFLISKYVKRSSTPLYHRKWYWMGWVFVWLATDELFALHEITAKPMRTMLQHVFQQENIGLLHFAWFVPYALVLTFVGFYFVRFVFSLPRKTLYNFILSGILFLGGAIGMEMVSGLIVSNDLLSVYKLVTTLEESFEMIGVIFFIYSLLRHLEDQKDLTRMVLDVKIDSNSQTVHTNSAAPVDQVKEQQKSIMAI
ncbi:hypothetical protein [Rufibacter hautae]|uniref:Uncharacterized protein n=1 Tax=Rufibacter hautae TaxID=2595005 RepID=A0A5B6TB18_9BACT|nr:hypothetical protein [Rufibacter hautae]KAA3436780.1 hypothetical protein FOA19_20605 [Rufibacter hautae]